MADDVYLPFLSGKCGWCREGALYPPDDLWSDERVEGDPPLAAIYHCLSCKRPSVVLLASIEVTGEGEDTHRALRIAPTPPPPALGVTCYADTTLEKYRDEAWWCFRARMYRSAIVTARSALQACCRRYVPPESWGTFYSEAETMSQLAGTGWDKIGGEVRTFGNRWAHPDPAAGASPTSNDAREALDRMDAVLQFIGALERFGHLSPVNCR